MTLIAINLANDMNTIYQSIKSNKITSYPTQVPYPTDPGFLWKNAWAVNYDVYANAGLFSELSVVMTPNSPTLLFNYGVYNADLMIADKISKYWQEQLTPGVPVFKSSITSITNDAVNIRIPIENWLIARNQSVSILSAPSYLEFVQFIQDQVNTIDWTVTEGSGVSSTTYTVNIS